MEGTIGSAVKYQGIPYYMNQMNEWVRTFAEKFNDILKSGFTAENIPGIDLFVADHATDGEQYLFPDEGRISMGSCTGRNMKRFIRRSIMRKKQRLT